MTLRLATLNGRAQLVVTDQDLLVDIGHASSGKFSSDPMECISRWGELRDFSRTIGDAEVSGRADIATLDCPVPRPRQMFAVGLNYKEHAIEMGSRLPATPLTFAKFESALNTPAGDIPIVGDTCDYEAETLIIIAIGGRDIAESAAWEHIAGLCVGQDISDRALQYSGVPPQFSLGKSRKGFAPIGPWVCDMSENKSRDALRMTCTVNGELRQQTSTDDMIFDASQIVSYLSSICELFSGDIIYTGTPAGVGHGRKPPVYLKPGDEIVTTLEGVGTLRNRCV